MTKEKQNFPKSGVLFDNLNKYMLSINESIKNELYCFPQHKIELNEEGEFEQLRSGPNWQGDCLTLTTCKQYLRSFKDPKDWINIWMAGFTPKLKGRNFLLWLAKIEYAFESNYDLGIWLDEKNLKAKNACNDPRGDIYSAKRTLTGGDRFKIENFIHPTGHTRTERYEDGTYKWWKDIKYFGARSRRSATLVFNKNLTFIWSKPIFYPNFQLFRSGKKFNSVIEFIDSLKNVNHYYSI